MALYLKSSSLFNKTFTKTINAPPSSGVGSTRVWAEGLRKTPTIPAYKSLYPCLSESCENLCAREPVLRNTSLTRSCPTRVGSAAFTGRLPRFSKRFYQRLLHTGLPRTPESTQKFNPFTYQTGSNSLAPVRCESYYWGPQSLAVSESV